MVGASLWQRLGVGLFPAALISASASLLPRLSA